MEKKVIRFFTDFIEKQEQWLNEMALQGFRLVRCSGMVYEFRQCEPGEYHYCVEFVGEKPYAGQKAYSNFSKSSGYRVYNKNINLSWALAKVRIRTFADKPGKEQVVPGAYKKELLIIEKRNDGEPFVVYTDKHYLLDYIKIIRNSSLGITVVCLILVAQFAASIFTELDFTWGLLSPWYGGVFYSLLSLGGTFLTAKYMRVRKRCAEAVEQNN